MRDRSPAPPIAHKVRSYTETKPVAGIDAHETIARALTRQRAIGSTGCMRAHGTTTTITPPFAERSIVRS